MKLRSLIQLVCLVFSQSLCHAQGKGTIELKVAPFKGMEYILDGKERLHHPALVLPAGEHRFVFYAPDRQVLDTVLRIVADTSMVFKKVLPATVAYRTYMDERRKVAQGRFFYRAVPLLATAVGCVFIANGKKQSTEAYDALVAAEDSYAVSRSPSGIDALKDEQLPVLQRDLDDANKKLGLALGFTSVAAVATVLGFIKSASLEDPVYEDREKIKFDGLVWLPGQQGGTVQFGMTIPIR